MWTKREDWDSNSTTEATFQTIRETVQVYERYYHVSQSLWHFHRTNEFRCNDWRQLKEYRSIPQAHGQMTDCNKTIPLLNFLLWKNTKFRGEGGKTRMGELCIQVDDPIREVDGRKIFADEVKGPVWKLHSTAKEGGDGLYRIDPFPSNFSPSPRWVVLKSGCFFFFFFSFRLDLFSVVGCCCRPSGDFSSFVMRLHDYPSSRTWKQDHYSLKKTHLRDQNN